MKICGGEFWDGARNGAISAGLNHAVHSGVFGTGLAMAAITGRTRHLFQSDASSFGVTGDASYVMSATGEKGVLWLKNGKDAGFYVMTDKGFGAVTDVSVSAGIELSEYYFSGPLSELTIDVFKGFRMEYNLNVSLFGYFGAGLTVVHANAPKTDYSVYGIGITGSIGFSLFQLPGNIGVNPGRTTVDELYLYGGK